jgi:hypothetical protein
MPAACATPAKAPPLQPHELVLECILARKTHKSTAGRNSCVDSSRRPLSTRTARENLIISRGAVEGGTCCVRSCAPLSPEASPAEFSELGLATCGLAWPAPMSRRGEMRPPDGTARDGLARTDGRPPSTAGHCFWTVTAKTNATRLWPAAGNHNQNKHTDGQHAQLYNVYLQVAAALDGLRFPRGSEAAPLN